MLYGIVDVHLSFIFFLFFSSATFVRAISLEPLLVETPNSVCCLVLWSNFALLHTIQFASLFIYFFFFCHDFVRAISLEPLLADSKLSVLDRRTKQHTQFGVSASNGSRDMAWTKSWQKKTKKKTNEANWMVNIRAQLDRRTKQHTQFGVSASNGSRDMAWTKSWRKKTKIK